MPQTLPSFLVYPEMSLVADRLDVVYLPINLLEPYLRNPRKKKNRAIEKVAASIREFGWRQPIVVDEDFVVIAGHTRLEAAQSLGLELVPVHVAKGLTPAQARAYRIADNRTNEDAEWDFDLLSPELLELANLDFDLGPLGFDADELNRLLTPSPNGDDGPIPTRPAEPNSERGAVYTLGAHRLMCGDATDPDDVRKLLGGKRTDCIWTDPPYGVNYVGKTKRALRIRNDGGDETFSLLVDAFRCSQETISPGSPFYIAAPAGPQGTIFRHALDEVGWQFHQCLVWVKDRFVLGHSDYHYQHEDILYGWIPGDGRSGRGNHDGSRWFGNHNHGTVFQIDRSARNAEHPTSKPVALVRSHILNSTPIGGRIYDPFGGSGTTLIAAEETGRVCYMMEIDPGYCDVIQARYERFVGGK